MFAVLDLSLLSVDDESAIVVSITVRRMETSSLSSLFDDDAGLAGGFNIYIVAVAHEPELQAIQVFFCRAVFQHMIERCHKKVGL